MQALKKWYTRNEEFIVKKSSIVALVCIVALVIAGGVYWYLHLLPLASSRQDSVQAEPVVADAAVALPAALAAPEVFQGPKEPSPTVEVVAAETATAADEPIETIPPAEQIDEPADLLAEDPVIHIEFDTLLAYLEELAPADALPAQPLPIFTTSAAAEPIDPPAVDTPTIAPIPTKTPSLAVGTAPAADEVVPTEKLPKESTPEKSESFTPAPVNEAVLQAPHVPKTALSISAALPLYWINSFKEVGYGVEAAFILAPKRPFQGSLSFNAREIDRGWVLDMNLGFRVVVAAKQSLSAHLSLGAGPVIEVKNYSQVGLLARASAGFAWNINDHLAITVGSGVSATWLDFKQAMPVWHLEAARIGFLLAF